MGQFYIAVDKRDGFAQENLAEIALIKFDFEVINACRIGALKACSVLGYLSGARSWCNAPPWGLIAYLLVYTFVEINSIRALT